MTLVETVLSMFLLVGVMLTIVNLFHASLRYQVRVENRGKMALLATRTIEDMRAYAQNPANFNGGLAFYNGRTWTEPDFPDFTIRTETVPTGRSIYSPCETLEVPWTPSGQARRLDNSVVPVKVSVSFRTDSVSLVGYIAEPARDPDPTLRITPLAVPDVPAGASFSLTVTAFDTGGVVMRDLFFDWDIDAETGNATITASSPRDGRTVTIINQYNGTTEPGTIRVTVKCRYRGQILRGAIGPINMLP